MIDYDDGRFRRRKGNLITEISILALAALLAYMFYDGMLTINGILHMVGVR